MRLFSDSIGRKAIMAVTGLLLIVFLIGHLLGNMTKSDRSHVVL